MYENPGQNLYKSRPLNRFFSEVPERYDLINRLFTLRLDEKWRKKATRECLQDDPKHVMDLGTGTGDLAIRIAKRGGKDIEITGYDFSEPMLAIARKKAEKAGVGSIRFIYGDAVQMPFPDAYFDAIGIAFAFRNLTYHNPDTDKYLAEVLRVLKPGGHFAIVESSQPKSRFLKKIIHLYLDIAVYRVGGMISGNKKAYHYLAHSAKNYYNPREVEKLLLRAGFSSVAHKPFGYGIAGLYTAIR
jgi:demethylmenaquinone methyltransferase/2-methoxy-6-polyprenyl-1,4-benzoquinol methylase